MTKNSANMSMISCMFMASDDLIVWTAIRIDSPASFYKQQSKDGSSQELFTSEILNYNYTSHSSETTFSNFGILTFCLFIFHFIIGQSSLMDTGSLLNWDQHILFKHKSNGLDDK